jgi:hypothetical protein
MGSLLISKRGWGWGLRGGEGGFEEEEKEVEEA